MEKEQQEKIFKDLKLDDIVYQTSAAGTISKILVNSIAKYNNNTQVNINGGFAFPIDKNRSVLVNSNSYYLTEEDAESSVLELVSKKIQQDTQDLVIREASLKERVLKLEELKKKYLK